MPSQIPTTSGSGSGYQRAIYALLADNELIAATADRGVVVTHRLGPAPGPLGVSHAMALSKDHAAFYVLVSRGTNLPAGPDRVDVVDSTTLRVRASYRLDRAVTYRSLALGPRTGRIFLFGNRPEQGGQSLLVTVLDPASGRRLDGWVARPANGRTWLPHRGIVTADERRLLVSYHGPDTTGADVLTLAGGQLIRCAGAPSWGGCLQGIHGDVVTAAEDRLLATTGDAQRIEELTLDGRIIRQWDSALPGNHLMELGLDIQAGRMYAIGSCGYAGGLSTIDLHTGQVRRLASPIGPRDPGTPLPLSFVCGERIEAGLGVLVVARTARPVPAPRSPGVLLLVGGQDGRLLRTVPTPSEPVDLLLAPVQPGP